MPKISRRSGSAAVESFLVQAALPKKAFRQTREQILAFHLLSRFQTDSTEEDEQEGRRTLFTCAAAAIPPVFISVILYPAYHPIAMPPVYRPYWSQVGDEYLYVLYTIVAMGIAAIVLWDTIFPDLLDVYALGVLPLSARLLLRSRWKAVGVLFGIVLLCVAAPGAILLPAVAEDQNFARHVAAHAIAAGAAGVSACALFFAVQSAIEIALGTRQAKQVMPLLQAGMLLAVFVLAGSTPHVLNGMQHGVIESHVPSIWFLAMYEQMKGGNLHFAWSSLAWKGWLVTVLSSVAAALTYTRAYHLRTLFLVESGNAAVTGLRAPKSVLALLHRTLVRTPGSRATFHLIAQTTFRVTKVRTKFVIYAGIGIAVLLAASTHTMAFVVAVASFAMVLGCLSVIQSKMMPRSAWVIQILPEPMNTAYSAGSRTIIALWSTVFALSALLVAILHHHPHNDYSSVLPISFSAALVLPSALVNLFMPGPQPFPFTAEQDSSPERFVLMLIRNAIAVPGAIVAFGWIAAKASASISGVSLWIASMCIAAVAVHRLHVDRGPTGGPPSGETK